MDFERFRVIATVVLYLLADISHPAGLSPKV
jgi:hypothetical protein